MVPYFSIDRVGFVGSGSVAYALGALAGRGFSLGFYDIDPNRSRRLAKLLGGEMFNSLEGLASWSDLIVVSVPGGMMSEVLGRVFDLLRRGDRIVAVTDVATFKSNIIGVYSRAPDNVIVASSHPLFGRRVSKPQAYRVVVIPIPGREGEAVHVEGFYKMLGVKTSIIDWETHDLMVARTIGLSYLVGLTVKLMHKDTDPRVLEAFMSTTFSTIWVLAEAVSSDPDGLIREIIGHGETVKVAGEVARLLKDVVEGYIEVVPGDDRAYDYIYRLVEGLEE